MKLTVDIGLLRQASAPLHRAAAAAQDIRSGSRAVRATAEDAGDEQLGAAIADFADAWGAGAQAVAEHGEALGRMVDRACSAYTESDRRAHRADGGVIGGIA